MAPTVPETVLRKRRRDEEWAAKKAAAAAEVRVKQCCLDMVGARSGIDDIYKEYRCFYRRIIGCQVRGIGQSIRAQDITAASRHGGELCRSDVCIETSLQLKFSYME
jgi:hypothetical protein